jgi:copper chaperone CopZ
MTMYHYTFQKRRRSILPTAMLTVGLAAWPQLGSSIAAQNPTSPTGAATNSTKHKTLQVRIAGMTCASCARGLEASFHKMSGIEKVAVDYKAGQAVITFDPTKQNADSLSKFVTDCGYQVKETKVI